MSNLADLIVDDDLDIALDNDTYQDQASPAPPLPGNYKIVIIGPLVPRKDDAGNVKLVDGKYPILTAMRGKIVDDGAGSAPREFTLFHDIRTKAFDRFGSVASDVMDLTRGMDQTRNWSGLQEGLSVLEELVAQNTPFSVKAAWEAFDSEFVSQEFERLGVTKANAKEKLSKDVYNNVYKSARKVTKDFLPNGKGGRIHVVKGKSGQNLEAKFVIKQIFPSLETVNLGAFRVK